MINIIPSISVIQGKHIRLQNRDYSQQVEYKDNPLDLAKKFEDYGIKRLHLIDLEGSKKGEVVNYNTLGDISGHTNLKIDFGGGIQIDGDISKAFEYGADRLVLGSMAITRKEDFASVLISYGKNRIMMSADRLDGKVTYKGWQKIEDIDFMDHLAYHYQRSVDVVKCADVSHDGTLKGPNFELYRTIKERFPHMKIMASGGISSMDDIKALNDMGLYGVILGKAFYENKISLKEVEQFIASESV